MNFYPADIICPLWDVIFHVNSHFTAVERHMVKAHILYIIDKRSTKHVLKLADNFEAIILQ
jgi:hypothetical protein